MLVTQDASPTEREGPATRTIAIFITVGVHLLLIVFAAIYSLTANKDLNPKIIASVQGPPPEKQQKIEKRTVKKRAEQVATAAPMTKMLRTDNLAKVAIPKMADLTDSPIGLGEGNLGVGFGRASTKNMGSGAMFFGQKVTGNLGVVFDVSGSMHEYVPVVVSEIQRNFRNAMVVCVNSSMMTFAMGDPAAVPYKDADGTNSRIPFLGSDVAKEMDRDLKSLPNCWFMDKNRNTLGHGIEYLMEQNIRTIFVFSDFHDTYHGQYIEQLTAEVKSESVQINLHVLAPLGGFNRGREPFLMELAKGSGGRYAVGELLSRVK